MLIDHLREFSISSNSFLYWLLLSLDIFPSYPILVLFSLPLIEFYLKHFFPFLFSFSFFFFSFFSWISRYSFILSFLFINYIFILFSPPWMYSMALFSTIYRHNTMFKINLNVTAAVIVTDTISKYMSISSILSSRSVIVLLYNNNKLKTHRQK